jgi:regulator of protease activity HflC (stomatin/prohibitin superfamily)
MSRNKLIFLGVLILSVQVLSSCARIPSGHKGVKWNITSGTQKGVLSEGIHFIPPWNKIYMYNVRTMDSKETLNILTNNGLTIIVETSVRFRPITTELYEIQTEIGPRYYDIIIGPSVRSAARTVGGRYSPEEMYSTKREVFETELVEEVKKAITGKHINLETILIRNVELPDKLRQAISDKLEEEQRALKMHFTLAKERQEAARKKIEAQGISDFQKVVSLGLTPMLLKWKGIEATEKLVSSPNSKVIVIGNQGSGGLPLILGTDK